MACDDFSKQRLRIAGIEPESIVDGPGIRLTVFVQGCPHHCVGCHNPQSHDFSKGHWISLQDVLEMVFANELLDGVTFSGGEPFCQAHELIPLARELKDRSYHLVIYTGFEWESLLEDSEKYPDRLWLLSFADLLIDGPFVYGLRTLDAPFKGSSNQRIIDVQASLEQKKAVLWSPPSEMKFD